MTADIATIQPPPARVAEWIGQATAVEQARAVAEVQAAIVVAQSVPRDMDRAIYEMRDSCGRMALASRAFYSVPNRGNGPSVHLARELARIFGNIQYGVHELRQDITGGTSEVQAFAWDVQTNTRSTRTFIVQHARMAGGKQKRLTDLGDIYLSNQNVGARAVRECIFSVLPTWLTEEAQDLARATLERGEGKPLEQRIVDAVAAFGKLGVTVPQLEGKIGRKRGTWNAADVAQLLITFTSITRDGLDKAEVFPSNPVTAQEILSQPVTPAPAAQQAPRPAGREEQEPPPEEEPPVSAAALRMDRGQHRQVMATFSRKGLGGKDQSQARHDVILGVIHREVQSSAELTPREGDMVIEHLKSLPDAPAKEEVTTDAHLPSDNPAG